jgi:DNA-binding NarL/FixJ family response regulator
MPSPPGHESSPSLAALGLTERQREVLALMMEGKSRKAICRVLGLAEPTVKYRVAAILKVLNAKPTPALPQSYTLGGLLWQPAT